MKKAIPFLLLFSMCLQIFANALTAGVFFLNQEQIAKESCINRFDKLSMCKGSCVLKKELSKTENHTSKNQLIKLKEIQLSETPSNELIPELTYVSIQVKKKILPIKNYSFNNPTPLFRPPCLIAT